MEAAARGGALRIGHFGWSGCVLSRAGDDAPAIWSAWRHEDPPDSEPLAIGLVIGCRLAAAACYTIYHESWVRICSGVYRFPFIAALLLSETQIP